MVYRSTTADEWAKCTAVFEPRQAQPPARVCRQATRLNGGAAVRQHALLRLQPRFAAVQLVLAAAQGRVALAQRCVL